MRTGRPQRRHRSRTHRVHPAWRPLIWSAVTSAAIAALFSPLPAMAAPSIPAAPVVPAVPDAGLRPIPTGSLVMPGQTTSTPITTTPISGIAMTPTLAKIEKARAQVALLGDRLLALNDELAVVRSQVTTAERRRTDAHAAVVLAEQAVTAAAADAFRDAAALPPGTMGSDLEGLGALAGIQRGEGADERAAARHLQLSRETEQSATAELGLASAHATDLTGQYNRLNTQHQREQAALQKLEQDNLTAINTQEAAERAEDMRLGAGFISNGSTNGKAADPRALAAVTYAMAQRGDPYVWSEEGPDMFDCSGLMWAAYRTPAAGSFPLPRVSRDQYLGTDNKLVALTALLPGDLLFFSSSASAAGIHHVAMYAGNGMMVEAPRTGLNVRLTPVRWTRVFAATRVYGPVDGPPQVPPGLNDPDPAPRPIPSRSTPPSPRPSTPSSRPTTPPATSPTPKPTRPKPPGPPRPPKPSQSSSPSPSGSASPSPSPSSSSPAPATSPTSSSPTAEQTSASPSAATQSASSDSSPSGGASSGGGQ